MQTPSHNLIIISVEKEIEVFPTQIPLLLILTTRKPKKRIV